MLVQLDNENIVRVEFIAKIAASGSDTQITFFDGTTTATIADLSPKDVWDKLERAGATVLGVQVIQG